MTDDRRAVVDAHVHQWDPFTTPRVTSGVAKVIRRAPFLLPLLLRMFPRSNRDFVADPQYLLNAYLPADYAADAASVPVGTIVHVEAGWRARRPIDSVDETRWVGSLPFGQNGAPALGAIVVHADPSDPEIADVLDAHLAASPLVRGVRCMAAHSPDPGVMNWTTSPQLFAAPGFLRGFAAVADRDLNFEIWVYGHQLPDALTLAREYPDTTFVLDHYATPVGVLAPGGRHTGTTATQRKNILERWRDDISALAAWPNVVAKHSGLGMPVLGLGRLPRDQLRDAVAPLVTHLDEAFGSERVFWSSNYPIDKPNLALPDGIWVLREVLGERFDEDRMLRENARRVYRI